MKKFRSLAAGCLIGAMVLTLIPVNGWAETQEGQNGKEVYSKASPSNVGNSKNKSTPSDADPGCICDDICFDDDVNKKCPVCSEDYEDCKWTGEIPIENRIAALSVTNPVPYEEIVLDGQKFSKYVPAVGKSYYHVLRYTVPEGESGHYTIEGTYDEGWYDSCSLYICNEEQYEALCHRIETEDYSVSASVPRECLAYDLYDSVGYQMEEGQDYYIISAQHKSYQETAYNLVFTRDIDVNLDCLDATKTGTPALYSKGSQWCDSSSRKWYDVETEIDCPEKSGFRFEGYYTAANGKGVQVIDDLGVILPALNELAEDCTVYACWKPFSPVSCQQIKLEGSVFSKVVQGGKHPYYQVFKFTVPEGGGGSYSFYQAYEHRQIEASGYLCTSGQYELLCHKIEQNKEAVWAPADCLSYDSYIFSINYNLESGKDYYFISAGYSNEEGDYKVVFRRDITVTLAAADADQTGTAAIYSNGGRWWEVGNDYSKLTKINRPKRNGYKFAGYFTGINGQGTKVIDYDGEILAELADLYSDSTVYAHWENFSPVRYEEVSLADGKFSITAIAEKVPYYKVFKFKVPENGSGYYSFYCIDDDDVGISGYLCTSAQYEALCRRIEADGCAPGDLNWPADYLVYNYNVNMTDQLENGQEYYFVATRQSKKYGEGEYQLLFRQDIEVKLDAPEADDPGTPMLYSMGARWSRSAGREWYYDSIESPQREGYLFAGYFTKKGGQGKMVIDQDGYIYDEEMHEFNDSTTIYAFWEDEHLEFKTEYLANGVKGVLYKQELAIASKMTFYWWVIGDLPEGLYLHSRDACIYGRPVESGTKEIEIVAYNSQITLYKKFSITIDEPTYSDDNEAYSGSWKMDETGNWRYYISAGSYYSNEWKFLEYNGVYHWYYFGSDGHINTGWFTDNGNWYYLNPASDGTRGAMQTGWLTDPQDGNRYYLDPQTGQMAAGWVYLDETWYYFNEAGVEYSGWKWDEAADAWIYENLGKQPLGALEPDKVMES